MPSTRAKLGLEQIDFSADDRIREDSILKRVVSARPQNVFLMPTGER